MKWKNWWSDERTVRDFLNNDSNEEDERLSVWEDSDGFVVEILADK